MCFCSIADIEILRFAQDDKNGPFELLKSISTKGVCSKKLSLANPAPNL